MSLLAAALLAAIPVLVGTSVVLAVRLADERRRLRRRLASLAAPLLGAPAVVESDPGATIFRETARVPWLFPGVFRTLEHRYPFLTFPGVLVPMVLFGVAGAVLSVVSVWLLRIPGGWMLVPVHVAVAGWGCVYALQWSQRRETARFVVQFPDVVDQIVRLSAAGVPPVEALSVVSEDVRPPVGLVLGRIADALAAGLEVETALRLATDRYHLPELTMFSAVLRLQRHAGGSVSSVLSNLATTLRSRHKARLKAVATTAQTRLTLVILAIVPVATLGIQRFSNPESLTILFDTEDGTTLLRWGVGLIALGILAARRLALRGLD